MRAAEGKTDMLQTAGEALTRGKGWEAWLRQREGECGCGQGLTGGKGLPLAELKAELKAELQRHKKSGRDTRCRYRGR